METPVRRVTRSQMSGLGPSSAAKPLAGRPSSTKKMDKQPRVPFADLTNDSPISGLMPAKMAAPNSTCVYESTPRSKLRPAERPIGEDLLRMQVTSLLRKVESEATLLQPSEPCVSSMFESPMRLAAPTPANTPATAPVETHFGEPKRLAPLVIASPVCHLEVALNLDRSARASVATPVLLSSVEQTSRDQQLATTRTLQFDSPPKEVSQNENAHVIEVSTLLQVEEPLVQGTTPASITTAEILISIEENSIVNPAITDFIDVELGHLTTTRTLDFESPGKQEEVQEERPVTRRVRFESPRHGLSGLFAPRAYPEAEDEDSWSVIVNVNSRGKIEDTTCAEDDVEAMDFVNRVLVDPTQPAVKPLAVWEQREPSILGAEMKDESEFEDAEEEEDEEDGIEREYDEEACEELCKGISEIKVGESIGLPEFRGKHIRFSYNSDDEIEEKVVLDKTSTGPDSPSKVKLTGYPTPKGTHLRFNAEDVDSDQDF